MSTFLEKFKGYRTVIFNVAAALAAALFGEDAVQALNALGTTTDQAVAALVALYAAANVALRAITKSAIFTKPTE